MTTKTFRDNTTGTDIPGVGIHGFGLTLHESLEFYSGTEDATEEANRQFVGAVCTLVEEIPTGWDERREYAYDIAAEVIPNSEDESRMKGLGMAFFTWFNKIVRGDHGYGQTSRQVIELIVNIFNNEHGTSFTCDDFKERGPIQEIAEPAVMGWRRLFKRIWVH